MALFIGLNNCQKGVTTSVLLNKAELFALQPVSTNEYFSDPLNVKTAIAFFESVEGNEIKGVLFNLQDEEPVGSIEFSSRARDEFIFKRIMLNDFDQGFLEVSSSQVPGSYNITLSDQPTIVLMHGAFSTSDIWGYGYGPNEGQITPGSVYDLLTQAGYTVIAPTLPNRGGDGPASLSEYVQSVTDDLADVNGNILFVGHSFGGTIAALMAEELPEKIRKIVFVASFPSQNGDSFFSIFSADPLYTQWFTTYGPGPAPGIPGNFLLDFVNQHFSVVYEYRGQLACPDAPIEVQDYVASVLLDENVVPLQQTMNLGINYAAVAKASILTSLDVFVSYAYQQARADSFGIKQQIVVPSAHLPQITQTQALVDAIIEFAQS